ncbi:protein PET100 homolog, mitochondrial-like [Teleopsis dalmanni]|uniref:protein PET100 homolog, mitochondrial-like n=1 Tax=Teleopsis dalmanni TaxID=139649 RepID=UPI0018CF94C6|nr:protein PET100 homolog, mitochondrial-like [Teleopsis dalmanni]XP_037952909.1 protein PET100 homolog, mitochondrial-like [Teleopsis dalmanni]
MGGWVLEVCKMAMYMTFPVALFHIFNQPDYFEEWVTKKKRELYPPENLSHRAEIEEAIRAVREKRNLQMMKAFDEIEQKSK